MSPSELKEARSALGLTQKELGEQLGVTANTVARWERGERTIPEFLTLALETIERRLKQNS